MELASVLCRRHVRLRVLVSSHSYVLSGCRQSLQVDGHHIQQDMAVYSSCSCMKGKSLGEMKWKIVQEAYGIKIVQSSVKSGPQIFLKSRSQLKSIEASKITWNKSHAWTQNSSWYVNVTVFFGTFCLVLVNQYIFLYVRKEKCDNCAGNVGCHGKNVVAFLTWHLGFVHPWVIWKLRVMCNWKLLQILTGKWKPRD